jgi:Melibiase
MTLAMKALPSQWRMKWAHEPHELRPGFSPLLGERGRGEGLFGPGFMESTASHRTFHSRSTAIASRARIHAWLVTALVAFHASAVTLSIANKTLTASYDAAAGTFSITENASGKVFVTDGHLEDSTSAARVQSARDPIFGNGRRIAVKRTDGGEDSLALYEQLPFLLVRDVRHNDRNGFVDLKHSFPTEFTLHLDEPADKLTTIGTGGLLTPDKNPGSYLFLTCAEPATRRGVVAGWVTEDRGSGVVFSEVKDGQVHFKAQIDYGRLRIPAGQSAELETLAIGIFNDARIGEELYADAVNKEYRIHLRPPSAVYCSWYADQHGQAGDEKSTVELARFAAKELKPFGFGVVQIDDEWQDGQHYNGPRRGFDRARPDGPYPHGMAPVAAAVRKQGLTFGLWWLPFGRNYQDPAYKERQDWFVKRDNGKPYDTSWGGTCLDLTVPAVQAQLAHIAKLYRAWGVRYFKMDGLYTGAACEQIYINDGYKDDHFGDNAPFHDPLVSNIEAFRNGLKLLRRSAGNDVFFSGCCVAQNMRELCAIGLVDSMRVGPDYNADNKGARTGPLRGSRLYFLNGRVWWNDPDPAIVRASGSSMGCKPVSLDQARLSASWVALSGQFFLNSDWLPDLPADRLEVLKRTLLHHSATARPVDYFADPLPNTWLVTATNDTVRRDVIGVFNWEDSESEVDDTCAWLGLAPANEYFAFDFWGNRPLPPFHNTFRCAVPAHSCRVLAVRAAEGHPILVSTSRHVTQGIVDVTGEKWDARHRTLSGTSAVVGNDPYELRLAGLDGNGKKWRLVAANVSPGARSSGVVIAPQPPVVGEDGWQRVTLRTPKSTSVRWNITFQSD